MKNKKNIKKLILLVVFGMIILSCGNSKEKENKASDTTVSMNNEYNKYLERLKSENNLKITMRGKPITIVGKETKVGDTLKGTPLTINTKLEDKNILEEKVIKVIYTAPSLDTKVCSLQTQMLNIAATKHTDVKFYSITIDTPFAQERFCVANEIIGLQAVSDYKYHQFGLQNGLYIKELGLLTRALIIVDENNVVKYIEYVKEESEEADVEKALKFLEDKMIKRKG